MFIECPRCGKLTYSHNDKCDSCGCQRSAWLPERAKLPAPAPHERSFEMGSWGGEPILWRVLGVTEDHLFAISEYGLDRVEFNEDRGKGNDWETSDLKAWLEQTFLPQAFTPDERARIDEISCLTSLEAESCFADSRDRMCIPTEYAVGRGVFDYEFDRGNDYDLPAGTCACHWWLRSSGWGTENAVNVGVEGLVFTLGWPVDSKITAVRPTLWVSRTPPS